MLSFLVKRLFQGIFVIVGLSILIFIIARIVPGDPARMSLGPRAPQFAVDELRREMHLDKSLPVQYFYWAEGVFRGDFGKSINTKRAVNTDIRDSCLQHWNWPSCREFCLSFWQSCWAARSETSRQVGGQPDTWAVICRHRPPAFVVAELLLLLFGYVWPIIPCAGKAQPETVPPHTLRAFHARQSSYGELTAFFTPWRI